MTTQADSPLASPRNRSGSLDLAALFEDQKTPYTDPRLPSTGDHTRESVSERVDDAALNALAPPNSPNAVRESDLLASRVTLKDKGDEDAVDDAFGRETQPLVRTREDDDSDGETTQRKNCCQRVTDFFCGCFKGKAKSE